MSDGSTWRAVRRAASLAWLGGSEAALRLAGRRGPYGLLTLDLGGDLAEEAAEQRMLGVLRRSGDDYFDLIALLRWARLDARLSGVLIRCDALHVSWARLQGLRRGVERLRQAGKRVWVHLDRAGIHDYYLAAAADRVSLAPSATLDVTGLSSEAVFFLGALEKVGVQAEIVQVGRYKSAGESVTRRSMSPEHREMVESLVDDLYGQIIDGVAAGRNLDPSAVRDGFDRGPFLAREALDAGLIDAIAYADEEEARLVEACGGAAVIDHQDYARRRAAEMRREVLRRSRGTIGLLHVSGTIKAGESILGPDGARGAGAASIAAALKELRQRDDVRAVIVRVVSPGGSGLASDLLWREIARTREQKPVVVSLGDVAASGGYYLAVAGHPILAEAGTITGSIGVVAGKANLRGLYEWAGITKEVVSRGRHATLFSDYAPLGDEERERIRAEADAFYADFVRKVAEGRRLPPETVAAAAEGRVWTGRQAWSRGLVDELGGIEEALDAAKRLAGWPVDEPAAVERFPKPRRLWKFSLDLNLPSHGRLGELAALMPPFRFVWHERVWAVLPFNLRFF